MLARTVNSLRADDAAPVAGAVSRMTFAVTVAVNLAVLYAPAPALPATTLPGADKAVHLAVFLALTLAGLRAGLAPSWFVPLTLAHALTSEVVQDLVLPRRSGDPWDAVADTVGVALGYLAYRRGRGPVVGRESP
jgi:hypothetical protein